MLQILTSAILCVFFFGLFSSFLLLLVVTQRFSCCILRPSSWMPCLTNSQTLKMISLVKSFPYLDKQGTPEECQWIQRPKRCVTTNNNKVEDNNPKSSKQNTTHQASSQKFRQIAWLFFNMNSLSRHPMLHLCIDHRYQILCREHFRSKFS